MSAQLRPVHLTPAASVSGITYDDLIVYRSTELRASLTSEQCIANHITTLRSWIQHLDCGSAATVGVEMSDRYSIELDRYLLWCIERGMAKSTIDCRRSMLGKWRDCWSRMCASAGLPAEFNRALQMAIDRSSFTLTQVAAAVGIGANTLRNWVQGTRAPAQRNVAVLRLIEVECGLQPGALASLLPDESRRPKCHVHQSCLTQNGKRQSALLKSRYRLSSFTPELQREWDALRKYKTSAYEPAGMKRRSAWREQRGDSPSADHNFGLLRSFYGYLGLSPQNPDPLPCGVGLAADAFTLAHLSDTSLVESYLEFRRNRSGGIYTRETVTFLALCANVVRPITGFLEQQPNYGARLDPPVAPAGWTQWCHSAHDRYRIILRTLKDDDLVKDGRVPEEPIANILALQHPIDVLIKLAEDMSAACPPATCRPVQLAVHMRNVLLVRMLTANPLRIKHFEMMTWRDDEQGNLFRKSDGSWWLRFAPEDFKNTRGAAREKYEAPLPKSLWSQIAQYLSTHRPHLLGGDGESDRVFLPSFRHREDERGGEMICWYRNAMSDMLRYVTQRYIPGCPGFAAHAFRHIIATDYIKNNPEGFEIAARVLHDKVETVIKEYGHLKTADFITHWNVYHEAAHRRVARA